MRRSHSPAEARWRRIIVLYTFFRDERAAFSSSSETLKWFAARRNSAAAAGAREEDAGIFERQNDAHHAPQPPAEEPDAARAPLGWWGSRVRRLARFGGQGGDEKPEAGSTSSGSEEEPDSRSGLARARHRFRCSVGVSGPEVAYEYLRHRE